MSTPTAGTQGWFTCESLSKRRIGVPGPNPAEPLDGSPYYAALKFRTHGRHKGHRSLWEWADEHGSWMLLVLDEHRNIVGQVFGRTQEACHRKMNAIYEAKSLGIYNGQYADGNGKAA
jgi:hypothetical protein